MRRYAIIYAGLLKISNLITSIYNYSFYFQPPFLKIASQITVFRRIAFWSGTIRTTLRRLHIFAQHHAQIAHFHRAVFYGLHSSVTRISLQVNLSSCRASSKPGTHQFNTPFACVPSNNRLLNASKQFFLPCPTRSQQHSPRRAATAQSFVTVPKSKPCL